MINTENMRWELKTCVMYLLKSVDIKEIWTRLRKAHLLNKILQPILKYKETWLHFQIVFLQSRTTQQQVANAPYLPTIEFVFINYARVRRRSDTFPVGMDSW